MFRAVQLNVFTICSAIHTIEIDSCGRGLHEAVFLGADDGEVEGDVDSQHVLGPASTCRSSLPEAFQFPCGRENARVERRIISLRQIASGHTAREAAAVEVNEKTVREWVVAFNSEGVASLAYDKCRGGIPHLTPEQESVLAEAIRKGPPPEMKLELWRGWAVRQWVKEGFGVEYCESGRK